MLILGAQSTVCTGKRVWFFLCTLLARDQYFLFLWFYFFFILEVTAVTAAIVYEVRVKFFFFPDSE